MGFSLTAHPKGPLAVETYSYTRPEDRGQCSLSLVEGGNTISIHGLTPEAMQELGRQITNAGYRLSQEQGPPPLARKTPSVPCEEVSPLPDWK